MFKKRFMRIPFSMIALLLSAIVFSAIHASPLPPSEGDTSEDRLARVLPSSNTRKNTNQVESANGRAANNTGSTSGSEEFTPWHQEQRNISGGGGDNLELDDSDTRNNETSSGSFPKKENETCTLEPAYLCPVHAQRNKEFRLQAIRDYVIRSLGIRDRPSNRPKDAFPFSGQLQTFYASCDSPSSVDSDTWNLPNYFHMYFNVVSSTTLPPREIQPSQNRSTMLSHEYIPVNSRAAPITGRKTNGAQSSTTVNIISAKLKLYKIGRGNQAEVPKYEAPTPSEPCNDTDSPAEIIPTVFPTSVELPAQTPVDERIRVTVYWYTTPLTKNHYKRKLLDTKMLSVKDSKWVEFDIQRAAKAWLEQKLNYGLLVEVENEDNDIVDANKYFSNLPCQLISGIRNNATQQEENAVEETPSQTGYESDSQPAAVAEQPIEILPPPVVEICTLTVPTTPRNVFQPTSFHPFSFPLSSSGEPLPSGLQKLSTMHQGMSPNDLWQNDDLNIAEDNSDNQPINQPQQPSHPHRHNHGKKNRQHNHRRNNSRSQSYTLGEDHPLRQILATAPSSLNSRENRQAAHRSPSRADGQSRSDNPLIYSDDEAAIEDGIAKGSEIIIQKIYITPPQGSNHNSDDITSPTLNR